MCGYSYRIKGYLPFRANPSVGRPTSNLSHCLSQSDSAGRFFNSKMQLFKLKSFLLGVSLASTIVSALSFSSYSSEVDVTEREYNDLELLPRAVCSPFRWKT